MNETNLFNSLRELNGSLSQTQVDSVKAILKACNTMLITDLHQISYIIATAYHEARLKPVRENGLGEGHSYGIADPVTHQTYYGRGLVQLTWLVNYKEFSKLLSIDLVNNPDLAMQTDYAAEIIVAGMKGGLFTGKSLGNYFTPTTQDPVNARRIINGTDQAQLISGYYEKIYTGITAS